MGACNDHIEPGGVLDNSGVSMNDTEMVRVDNSGLSIDDTEMVKLAIDARVPRLYTYVACNNDIARSTPGIFDHLGLSTTRNC
jgi:hypothetical protein